MRKIIFWDDDEQRSGSFHQFVVVRTQSHTGAVPLDEVMAIVEHNDGRVDVVPATAVQFVDYEPKSPKRDIFEDNPFAPI